MSKNIILCSNSTVNKAADISNFRIFDSIFNTEANNADEIRLNNIYKIYNAVDIHYSKVKQHKFHDNNTETSANKLLQLISIGLGVGFKNNVCDLYKYLARNYKDGDRIYLFGFSRGAAIVRALTGFIGCCGLISGRYLDQVTLDQETDNLFKAYEKAKDGKTPLTDNWPQGNQGAVPIEFVGVWDTVSALGYPRGTDTLGPMSWLLNTAFNVADDLSNAIVPHRFYQYQLFDNIKHAYHAVAIDDERASFQPIMWDETGRPEGSVEQVWFTGTHESIVGGYDQDGLANISLCWIMIKAKNHGLIFNQSRLQEAFEDCDPSAYMPSNRSWIGVIREYQPREIEKLCGNKTSDIKIHQSVLKRMSQKTANYAPGNLPPEFLVIQPSLIPGKKENHETLHPGSDENWIPIRKKVDSAIYWRKESYIALLCLMLVIVVTTYNFWENSVEECNFKVVSTDNSSEGVFSGLTLSPDDTFTGCENIISNNTVFILKKVGDKLSVEMKIEPNIDNEIISRTLKFIAKILYFFLPDELDPLIQKVVIEQPQYFVITLIFSWTLSRFLIYQEMRRQRALVKLRKIVLNQYRSPDVYLKHPLYTKQLQRIRKLFSHKW